MSNVLVEFIPNGPERSFLAIEPVQFHYRGTSGREEIFRLSAIYECKLQCLDVKGNLLPTTKVGKKLGVKFDSASVDSSKYRRSGSHLALYGVSAGSVVADVIPPPAILFRLEQSKSYTLKAEIQCVLRQGTNRTLIKFKPVELKILN